MGDWQLLEALRLLTSSQIFLWWIEIEQSFRKSFFSWMVFSIVHKLETSSCKFFDLTISIATTTEHTYKWAVIILSTEKCIQQEFPVFNVHICSNSCQHRDLTTYILISTFNVLIKNWVCCQSYWAESSQSCYLWLKNHQLLIEFHYFCSKVNDIYECFVSFGSRKLTEKLY